MSAACEAEAIEDLEWAIGLNRLSLKIFGVSGTTGNKSWRDVFSNLRIIMLFIAILVFMLVPVTTALMKVWGHLLLMMDNFLAYHLFATVDFEVIVFWHKKEVLMMMMEYIKNDWMRPKTKDERQVMLRYGKLSRTITIVGYGMIVLTVTCYNCPVAFGSVMRTLTNLTDVGDRPFVVQTSYFFDAYKSPVYELVVFSQFFACGVACFFHMTLGTLFAVLVLHVSAQLENLAVRIENIEIGNDAANFQIEFKTNTEEHQRLIRFAEMIENAFSVMLLEVVIGFTLILCIQAYELVVVLTDDVERPLIQVLYCISYLMYQIFIMFVYSAVGDILVTQSEGIQYAAYNCQWYKLNYREAAQFIPVLLRSQRPLAISVGKFTTLSLPTFASLMKTAAGYLSVLLAVRE